MTKWMSFKILKQKHVFIEKLLKIKERTKSSKFKITDLTLKKIMIILFNFLLYFPKI